MSKRSWLAGIFSVIGLTVVGLGSQMLSGPGRTMQSVADEIAPDAVQVAAATGTLQPDAASAVAAPAVQLSAAELEALRTKLYARRLAVAAAPRSDLQGPPGLPDVVGRGSVLQEATGGGAGGRASQISSPTDFFILRNNRNTSANGAQASTLAEPAAVNNGTQVLASGNFSHFEFSRDG